MKGAHLSAFSGTNLYLCVLSVTIAPDEEEPTVMTRVKIGWPYPSTHVQVPVNDQEVGGTEVHCV